MRLDQSKEEMHSLQCVHSLGVDTFYSHWEDHCTVNDLEDRDASYRVFCNLDITVQTLLDEDRFLAAIQTDNQVTLQCTVGKKQKFPLCTEANCSKQTKCICYNKYKKLLDEQGNDENSYYWDKRSRKKHVLIDHFLESIPLEVHHHKHDYNLHKLEYPIKRCPEMQDKFLSRLGGVFNLPESIKPEYDDAEVCQHDEKYSADDDKLLIMSPNLTVYTESSDRIYPIPTYGRPTVGECKCILQVYTHDLLLWNMGSGKLLDYLFLHNHFHKWVSSAIAMNGSFNSRERSFSDIGVHSSLSYSVFLRACTGYARMIQFRKEDFLCPSCGDSPNYIVCDGKTDGPTKRKLEHLQELDRAEDDESVLCQGSMHHVRVFLPQKKGKGDYLQTDNWLNF